MRWKRTELAYLACIQPWSIWRCGVALQIGTALLLLGEPWCICRWSAPRRLSQRHELGSEASLAKGLVPVLGECCLTWVVVWGNGFGLVWVPSWQSVAVACDTCQRSVRSCSSSHSPSSV